VSGIPYWLSRDPIAENGGINLYQYVGNNPLNYWDPNGLEKDGPGLPERIGLDEPEGQLDIFQKILEIIKNLRSQGVKPGLGSAGSSACMGVVDPMVKIATPENFQTATNLLIVKEQARQLLEGEATTDSLNELDKKKTTIQLE